MLPPIVETSRLEGAYEHGFAVVTLTDCVAATSVEAHDNAIEHDYPMFSAPMTAAALIEALG